VLLRRGKTQDPSTSFHFGRDDASKFALPGGYTNPGTALEVAPKADAPTVMGFFAPLRMTLSKYVQLKGHPRLVNRNQSPTAADVGHLQSMPFRNLCWELE
jgi:hypothetical protein